MVNEKRPYSQMISIVIPTYNEEKYLPKLLKSIKKQSFDYETIVADNSDDNTAEIAKKFGCKVVRGGGFSEAWNNGVIHANHDLLLLCADTILPKNFHEFLDKIEEDRVDLATCFVKPSENKFSYNLWYNLKNNLHYLIRFPIVHCNSQCIFVKKKIYEKINGFNEDLILGEEHDFINRAVKHGKFKFYRNFFVYNSPRRLEKEGVLKITYKSVYSELYRMFVGPIKKPLFEYEFGHY